MNWNKCESMISNIKRKCNYCKNEYIATVEYPNFCSTECYKLQKKKDEVKEKEILEYLSCLLNKQGCLSSAIFLKNIIYSKDKVTKLDSCVSCGAFDYEIVDDSIKCKYCGRICV